MLANARSRALADDRLDLSGFSPDIAAFHAYWDGKRRDRAMPSRADIDPAEMKRFLPGITLIDVDGGKKIEEMVSQFDKAIGEVVGFVSSAATELQSTAQSLSAIASAVEEQGAATQEISRNVQEASTGTSEVSSNIGGVTQASQHTSAGSTQVLSAATELAMNGARLKKEIQTFLHSVRAA